MTSEDVINIVCGEDCIRMERGEIAAPDNFYVREEGFNFFRNRDCMMKLGTGHYRNAEILCVLLLYQSCKLRDNAAVKVLVDELVLIFSFEECSERENRIRTSYPVLSGNRI